ncbi:Caspase domain-containing protein [Fusarium heterosporum]|uniref:Caspase domain-containing protein n=1 Tax=Fusarium heterosporum TaxID=42747 RepID=A0A8H5TPV5_FUSHE|nr:Caspase domain-containing protein [Fusarium heterosporum]
MDHSEQPEIQLEGENEFEQLMPAIQLPAPGTAGELEDLPLYPPELGGTKGWVRGVHRTLTGVPSCVWVINEHDQEITVVVAKDGPHRLVTGGGLEASASGGGLNLETSFYMPPATIKKLGPQQLGRAKSMGRFYLPTRKDKYGAISIFVGTEMALYIANDKVELGATAYFENEPNLRIVPYDQEEGK